MTPPEVICQTAQQLYDQSLAFATAPRIETVWSMIVNAMSIQAAAMQYLHRFTADQQRRETDTEETNHDAIP